MNTYLITANFSGDHSEAYKRLHGLAAFLHQHFEAISEPDTGVYAIHSELNLNDVHERLGEVECNLGEQMLIFKISDRMTGYAYPTEFYRVVNEWLE